MSVTSEKPLGAAEIRPFTFEASDADLEELRARVAAMRWPEVVLDPPSPSCEGLGLTGHGHGRPCGTSRASVPCSAITGHRARHRSDEVADGGTVGTPGGDGAAEPPVRRGREVDHLGVGGCRRPTGGAGGADRVGQIDEAADPDVDRRMALPTGRRGRCVVVHRCPPPPHPGAPWVRPCSHTRSGQGVPSATNRRGHRRWSVPATVAWGAPPATSGGRFGAGGLLRDRGERPRRRIPALPRHSGTRRRGEQYGGGVTVRRGRPPPPDGFRSRRRRTRRAGGAGPTPRPHPREHRRGAR